MATNKKRNRIFLGCAAAALGLLAALLFRLLRPAGTPRKCPIEQLGEAYRFYVVCTATGESCPMDLYSRGEDPAAAEDTHSIVLSGQDKTGGNAVFILKSPGRASGLMLLQRGEADVSLPGDLYCAACLSGIAAAAGQSDLPAFVLYDREEDVFYPIDGLPAALGGYLCETAPTENGYRVAITWAG